MVAPARSDPGLGSRMKRDKQHDKPRFGTMLMEPPPKRAHSGTMVLEAPTAPPFEPIAPPFEPTHVLGADYAHLSSFHEEHTVTADASAPRAEPLPFRTTSSSTPPPQLPREARPAPDLVDAPTRVNPTPRFGAPPSRPPPAVTSESRPAPPPYLGAIDRRDRAACPSEAAAPVGPAPRAESAYRNEPVAPAPLARPSPPPPRNDARASSEKRLSSLLHGPWLFPDDDD